MKVTILEYSSYALIYLTASISDYIPSFMDITEVLNEVQTIALTWVSIGIGVSVIFMNRSTTRKNNSEREANERRDSFTTMKHEIKSQMQTHFKNMGKNSKKEG